MNDRFKVRIWWKKENRYRVDTHIIRIGHLTDFANSDEYVVEQCTGLKDKNGNLIYEGDILLCDRKIVDCAAETEIHYKSSGVVQREKNGKYFINGKDWEGSDITFYNEYAEIIGNIHEIKGGTAVDDIIKIPRPHKKEMQWLKIACNDFVRIAKLKGWIE